MWQAKAPLSSAGPYLLPGSVPDRYKDIQESKKASGLKVVILTKRSIVPYNLYYILRLRS